MKPILAIIMASGLVLGAPLAANAQYLEPANPNGMVEQQPLQAPLAEAESGFVVPGQAVRIVIVDPAAANAQMNALAQSGELAQAQGEVSADPELSAQLAAANIAPSRVFEVARDIDGTTTIYASG